MNPIVNALIGPIAGLLDKIIPDKDAREKMAHEIALVAEKQVHDQIMAQVQVNMAEAAHKSLFVAGWRPFIGWVCGAAMGFNYMVVPLVNWGTQLYGVPVEVPVLDMEVMMPVLLGMLGLGGMRSYEKRHGVARESMPKGK